MKRVAVSLDLGTAETRMAGADGCWRTCASGRALAAGVVVDRAAVAALVRPWLRAMRGWLGTRLHVLATVPTDARPEERGALVDAVRDAGAAAVALVPEPLAAAVGAGVDVASSYAQLVLDAGAGVTDCALVRDGRVLDACAVRIGCADFRGAIAARRGMTAEQAEQALRAEGAGALPEEILAAAVAPTAAFVRALPPLLACEIIESGIVLTGGGALLPGLAARVAAETGITVRRAPDPRHAVIAGAAAMLPVAAALDLWSR